MKSKVLSATEFKAKCLACLSEIEQEGGSITITKRGRPVAVVGPVKRVPLKSPKGSWAKKGRIVGDIINTDFFWEVTSQE
jgi:prevent-host-death family protein